MAVYAIAEDIERLMAQFVVSGSSKPTRPEVETIIADTEHEVNVALAARRVIVPVTGPDYFFNWLGLLVSYGATAAVLKSMFPSASGPAETPAYAFWESRYRLGLKGITDGTLIPDEVISTNTGASAITPATYFTRNPGGEESLGVHEPWFGRSFQP